MTSNLLCHSYKDEWKLCTLIKVRQCKPDEDSVILTKTLLQEFANKPPFCLSFTTSSSLSRHMIGNELADELGLLSFNVFGQIVMTLLYWLLRIVSFIQRCIPSLERRMYTFGSCCLNTLLEQSLKGRKPSYIMKVYTWIPIVRVCLLPPSLVNTTFFYRTVSLWNCLDDSLKLCDSSRNFKRKLRAKLFAALLSLWP